LVVLLLLVEVVIIGVVVVGDTGAEDNVATIGKVDIPQ